LPKLVLTPLFLVHIRLANNQRVAIQSFLAIDFETANYASDSACSIGLVRVESGQVVQQDHFLIQPPSASFVFTYIHGITWEHVAQAPNFAQLWPRLKPFFSNTELVIAHNVNFDRKVLQACADRYSIKLPDIRYECTVRLARKLLGIYPTNLPAVCARLSIPLKHHDALSDAIACAHIALKAFETPI
jgi:DNA polymerase-3 subunit epsilon